MTSVSDEPLAPMLRKLALWKALNETEQAAVLALPHTVERVPPGRYLLREGDRPNIAASCSTGSPFVKR